MIHNLTELAQYLNDREQVIIDRWLEVCEADEAMGVVGRLTRADFRNNIPAAIGELCELLKRGTDEADCEAVASKVAEHGHHRWKQGFSLKELIRDWGNINRVLVGVVREYYQADPSRAAAEETEALDRLARFLTEATSGSVSRFDELRRAEAASLEQDVKLAKQQFEALTEARGQMLREAAHDIRGGLSAIAGASAVLKGSQEPNQSFAEALDVLDGGVESVGNMLNSLLDLSRLESGADGADLLPVDVAAVLGQLVAEHQAVAAEKGLELTAEGPEEAVVETDPSKLRRIAQNLLVNALEHTTSGEVAVSWKLESQRWMLTVRDTGPGIQDVLGSPVAKELNHPDRDHSQLKAETPHAFAGEGIGLTIVKRLCEMLEAGITLESEMGQGTTFTVELPLRYDK